MGEAAAPVVGDLGKEGRRMSLRGGLFKLACVAVAALVVCPAIAGSAGRTDRLRGSLELNATFSMVWNLDRPGSSFCPPGTLECIRYRGTQPIRGLGNATLTYTNMIDDQTCTEPPRDHVQAKTLIMSVAGKGDVELSLDGVRCYSRPPVELGPYELQITHGSGRYAGATGTVVFAANIGEGNPSCGCGSARDTLAGTLSVPDLEFDVTAPAFRGVRSKTVTARRPATRVRVARYSLKARDVVDGPVAVKCTPRAGSFFKPGRTRVKCSATDTSANTATASFTVTVKRARR
jgi:hypothetical protein